jgi:MSHA pilin protein MshC
MNQFRRTSINNRGFTLIETIAVIIIIGILAAVAISHSATQSYLVPEVGNVQTQLRFAQLKALGDDLNTWSIAFTAHSYTLGCTAGTGGTCSSTHLPGEIGSTHTFSSSVTATTAPTVTFDSWGSPGTADIPIVLSERGNNTTVTVHAYTGYITPW